jgi:hypothetical protein
MLLVVKNDRSLKKNTTRPTFQRYLPVFLVNESLNKKYFNAFGLKFALDIKHKSKILCPTLNIGK